MGKYFERTLDAMRLPLSVNIPVQQRAAQRTVRCNRLFGCLGVLENHNPAIERFGFRQRHVLSVCNLPEDGHTFSSGW